MPDNGIRKKLNDAMIVFVSDGNRNRQGQFWSFCQRLRNNAQWCESTIGKVIIAVHRMLKRII